MEPLLYVLIVGVILALVLWVVRRYIPMDQVFYGVLAAIVVIGFLIYAVRALGLV